MNCSSDPNALLYILLNTQRIHAHGEELLGSPSEDFA
jgi:hypothetical protein